MKILAIGATGSIGSYVIHQLRTIDWERANQLESNSTDRLNQYRIEDEALSAERNSAGTANLS